MSNQQLHKRLSRDQIITIVEAYLSQEIDVHAALESLGIKRSRFFVLLKEYKENPDSFTLDYTRTSQKRISQKAEKHIIAELKKEKDLIDDKNILISQYNYSALRDTLLEKYNVTVSVPTIIKRAKQHGYYQRKKQRKIHDRAVLTNFVGELVQHDTSFHLWSPFMDNKLPLVTSLDDHSRLLLFADFFERETVWAHIQAVKAVVLRYGCSLKYYTDQHSIFRFVRDRDKQSPWQTYMRYTDDVSPQWKQTLQECNIGITYALSPQAKGKVERSYRWLQDRIVRIAAKDKLTTIGELRPVLHALVEQYNTKWVHSTTKEIPIVRFEKALNTQHSLFRPFKLSHPDQTLDDIFCIRAQRRVDAYRKISLDGVGITVPKGVPRQNVLLRIVPDVEQNMASIRFWQDDTFLGNQNIPLDSLKTVVHF